MKNLVSGIIIGLFVFLGGITVLGAEEQPSMLELVQATQAKVDSKNEPKAAVLIDVNTGKLLWEKEADLSHNPASIIKLLTAYKVFEAIEEGKFTLETKVIATPRYEQIAGIYALSNNKIKSDVAYPVKELLSMMLVPSSNVATIMLAELVEPDAAVYLKELNQLCQNLGMTNTTIYNATGAQISAFQGLYAANKETESELEMTQDNKTTARDLAIFTRDLLIKYPEILTYTSESEVKVMSGTAYEESFESYNYSLPGLEYEFEGVDGLKTGSSISGAFNIDGTAKRGEMRLIAIVLGVGDWSDQNGEYYRHPFMNALFNYGFNNFAYQEVLSKGKHEIDGTAVELAESFKDTVKKNQPASFKLVNDSTIELKNPLPTISPLIKETSVKLATKENDGFLKTPTEQKKLQFITKNIKYLGAGFIVIIFIGLFIFIMSNKKRKKRVKSRYSNRSDRYRF